MPADHETLASFAFLSQSVSDICTECIVHGFIIEEIACANLLFEGLGNLPPGGFQIEEGQVEQTIPGTTLGTTLVDQTPSHFK